MRARACELRRACELPDRRACEQPRRRRAYTTHRAATGRAKRPSKGLNLIDPIFRLRSSPRDEDCSYKTRLFLSESRAPPRTLLQHRRLLRAAAGGRPLRWPSPPRGPQAGPCDQRSLLLLVPLLLGRRRPPSARRRALSSAALRRRVLCAVAALRGRLLHPGSRLHPGHAKHSQEKRRDANPLHANPQENDLPRRSLRRRSP